MGDYRNADKCTSVVLTASGLVCTGKCLFWAIAVENYDADFVITLDDSTDGNGNDFLVIGGALERGGAELSLPIPRVCDNGIYATFTTSGNNVTVFYTDIS